jgi:putative transposase
MPQSLTRIFLHIFFSTKYHHQTIHESIENELFGYLGSVCRDLECHPIEVGGYVDHVHILASLSKKITVMTLLHKVKQNSSLWIKTKGIRYAEFYWQDGYAAHSVSPAELGKVTEYIRNQKAHHRKVSFQDECRALFKEYGIEFDERYVWD